MSLARVRGMLCLGLVVLAGCSDEQVAPKPQGADMSDGKNNAREMGDDLGSSADMTDDMADMSATNCPDDEVYVGVNGGPLMCRKRCDGGRSCPTGQRCRVFDAASVCLDEPPMMCGNGQLDPGELCDGDCPADVSACDDQMACTTDALTGAASTCDAQCTNTPITACISQDGCCPTGCDSTNDDDCQPPMTCGNGQLDPGERCDGDCPADVSACDDQMACTKDSLVGNPMMCDALCAHEPILRCIDLDGCCPTGCDSTNDNDCAPVNLCGNGQLDLGERCDGDCPTDVAMCDDNNACTTEQLMGAAFSCDAQCSSVPVTACVDQDGCCPMGCDNTNDNDCAPVNLCGNGQLDPGELCDGAACPADVSACDDRDACTVDALTGSAMMCDAQCQYSAITSCINQDGCCPAGCNSTNDDDCSTQVNLCGEALGTTSSYGPASVWSSLAITPSGCCFDYNGDNTPDSALGDLLSLAGTLSGTNASLAQSIASGALAMVMEHNPLSSLSQGSFTTNLLSGLPQCFMAPSAAGSNVYKIDASSYAPNMSAVYQLPNGQLTGNLYKAGPGRVRLPLNFLGVQGLSFVLEQVRVEATVDPTRSMLPSRGVALINGKFGGLLRFAEIAISINAFGLQNCGCWSNPLGKPLMTYTAPSTLSCDPSIGANACNPNDPVEAACRGLIVDFCPYAGVLVVGADVDSTSLGTDCINNMGPCDAMSVGATFEAHGALLQGVSP